jgi:hypothetical protein
MFGGSSDKKALRKGNAITSKAITQAINFLVIIPMVNVSYLKSAI